VVLLDNDRLQRQLLSLERRTRAGRDAIDHPRGAHDDLANAVAAATSCDPCCGTDLNQFHRTKTEFFVTP
jgi:hypothetical protein